MNKLLKGVLLVGAITTIGFSSAIAAPNYTVTQVATPQYADPLQGNVVFTPAGITTNVVTSAPISSETMYQGAPVRTTMPSALTYNGKTIAPAGSMIDGSVITVKKAGRASQNGQVYIRFNSLTTPQGFRIPISAIIKTDDNTGLLKGGTKKDIAKEYAKDAVVGAGAGALTGLVAGAISDGKVGKTTAIMTGIGAGVGVGKSLIDKGQPVEIPANSQIEVYFDQPITVSAPTGYDY